VCIIDTQGFVDMVASATWYITSDDLEVMEIKATDLTESITSARSQLIQLAATLMEDSSNQLGRLETPEYMKMERCSARSITMIVAYASQVNQGLGTRMKARRRAMERLNSQS
jgi:hypothetical protein